MIIFFLIGLLGIVGVSLFIFLGLGVMFWYFVWIEIKELNVFWKEWYFGWKLIISFFCMIVVLFLYYGVLNIVFGFVIYCFIVFFVSVIGVGIGVFVFIYVVICFCLFIVREWFMLLFGKKILWLNKKIKKWGIRYVIR